jgi:DNA-binding transcriptional regulator LsrR (DeoR family)
VLKKDVILGLKKKYDSLREIFLARSVYDYAEQKRILGRKAAQVFENIILNYNCPRVGIGGGSTIYEMVNSLSNRERKIRIFPTALMGRGPEVNFIDSTFLVTLLFLKSKPNAKAFVINIPPLPNTVEKAIKFKAFLLANIAEVNWLYNAMQHDMDVAFVGLGATIPTGDFDGEMIKLGLPVQSLKDMDIFGGINYNWFKEDGSQCLDYFLTISIERLKEFSKSQNRIVSLVAGGVHKLTPLRIALRQGMANYLITDINTSESLLKD